MSPTRAHPPVSRTPAQGTLDAKTALEQTGSHGRGRTLEALRRLALQVVAREHVVVLDAPVKVPNKCVKADERKTNNGHVNNHLCRHKQGDEVVKVKACRAAGGASAMARRRRASVRPSGAYPNMATRAEPPPIRTVASRSHRVGRSFDMSHAKRTLKTSVIDPRGAIMAGERKAARRNGTQSKRPCEQNRNTYPAQEAVPPAG